MLRKTLLIMGVAVSLLTAPACDKDDDDEEETMFHFMDTMSGAKESPVSTSTATGTVMGDYDKNTKILTVTVSYSGMTGTILAWHVHKGAVGVSGPPLSNITWSTVTSSPFTFSLPALDATQEADLLNNLYYVNLHTAAHPGGEIRGQLLKQ